MDTDTTRLPAVAGAFYPAEKDELFESIHRSFTHHIGPGYFPQGASRSGLETFDLECLIVPHAGYEYSGPVAANSYDVASTFFQSHSKTVIILGPNHYGIGSGVSLSAFKKWVTPLGTVDVNSVFSSKLLQKCNMLDSDKIAHSKEHSIEVQLPFLQAVSQGRSWDFVPISLMLQDLQTSKELSDAIFEVIRQSEGSFLLIGSSDLTHYEPHAQAKGKDLKLLETIRRLDTDAFYTTLERLSLTACGYGAIATVMQLAKKMGRREGLILRYATSGDVTGDNSSVVGYPSVRFV
ncbi:MAG: AmmeMemoRadiSam system protein B [Nitrososphaerota archaeon]|nr:AmmeMemoRadiSam system protein B [Nitrososphaerota archaeon]